jgi:hypothetical protein
MGLETAGFLARVPTAKGKAQQEIAHVISCSILDIFLDKIPRVHVAFGDAIGNRFTGVYSISSQWLRVCCCRVAWKVSNISCNTRLDPELLWSVVEAVLSNIKCTIAQATVGSAVGISE